MPDIENLMVPGPVGRISVRTKGMAAKPPQVVVLVQGSNLTGQSIFDFSFPGGERYSVMNEIVAMGFGAVTFSIRGYGASELPGDPFAVQTDAAIDDLAAVFDWLAPQGYACPHLLGFSWGGRTAGRFTEQNSHRVDRLVLYDPALGGSALILPAPIDPWFVNTPEFYLERFEPEFTEPALRAALAAHVVAHDARSPNGIRLENATSVIPVRPEAIIRPTMLVYGVEAGKAAYMQTKIPRAETFERLATGDKMFAVLPGCGDFAHLQRGRLRLYKVIGEFLSC